MAIVSAMVLLIRRRGATHLQPVCFLTVGRMAAKLERTSRSGQSGGSFGGKVTNLNTWLLESKVDMKDVGEAMFVVLVVALTFVITIVWAKWNKKRRSGK